MKEQNSKAKKNKINFIIPDFLNVDECVYLLDTFISHKEVFKENINIIGLHGMFVGHSWNIKNKKFEKYTMNYEWLNKLKNKYNNEYNISLYISFDKEEVSVKDLEDEYSNKVMEIFNDKKNYVICKSRCLAEYIEETYKNVRVIVDLDRNKNQNNEYLLVNPKLNKNEIIKKYKNPEKLILIPDGGFIPNRKHLFNHKKSFSKLFPITPKKDRYYTSQSGISFIESRQKQEYLSFEDLEEYAKLGINTFMFSGLGVYNVAMYQNYIDYIYKDEYQMDARIMAWNHMLQLKDQEERAIYNYEI